MDAKPNRKALSHERILDAAAGAIRRAGFDGVGVADLMKAAGLTHGGFYAHFASRDAMLAEAIAHAGRGSTEAMAASVAARAGQAARDRHDVSPLRALVESYLSDAHLAAPEAGCPVAALCSEMPRQAPAVREASRDRVQALIKLVKVSLPRGTPPGSAMAVASTLVGALQLARALGGGAPGQAVLAASRKALIAQFDPSPREPAH